MRGLSPSTPVATRPAGQTTAKGERSKADAEPFEAELKRAGAASPRAEARETADKATRAAAQEADGVSAKTVGPSDAEAATSGPAEKLAIVETMLSVEEGTAGLASPPGMTVADQGKGEAAPDPKATDAKKPAMSAAEAKALLDATNVSASKDANASPHPQERVAPKPETLPSSTATTASARTGPEANTHPATAVVPTMDRLVLGPAAGQSPSRAPVLTGAMTETGGSADEGLTAKVTDQRAYFPPISGDGDVSGGLRDGASRFARGGDDLERFAFRQAEAVGEGKKEFAVSLADELSASARGTATAAQPVASQAASRIMSELAQLQADAARAQASEARGSADSPEVLRTLSLELQPKSLGTIRVDISLRGGELVVQLRPDQDVVAQQLDQDRATLSKMLSASGYDLKDLVVETLSTATQVEPGARTDTDPMRQEGRAFEDARSQRQGFADTGDRDQGQRPPVSERDDPSNQRGPDARGDATDGRGGRRIVV